jgi:hypothetical protein
MCWRRIGAAIPEDFRRTGHPGRRPLVGCNSAGGPERGGQTVPELAADIGHRRPIPVLSSLSAGTRTGRLFDPADSPQATEPSVQTIRDLHLH